MPLTAVVVSDQFLGGYERLIMVAVYATGLAPVAFGWLLKTRPSVARLAAATVVGSLLFYLVTNAAVWYAWYPHSWEGLARCYAVAVPFFKYTRDERPAVRRQLLWLARAGDADRGGRGTVRPSDRVCDSLISLRVARERMGPRRVLSGWPSGRAGRACFPARRSCR